jgi:hypothetical protein
MESEIINGSRQIRQLIESGETFFVGRNGSTELEVLTWWYTRTGAPFPQALMDKFSKVSGIWPATQESIKDWVTAYTAALGSLDGLAAGWFPPLVKFEGWLLDMHCPKAFRTPLRSLEPYYVEPDNRWSAALQGKRVAIVSSFADTIQQQVAKLHGPRSPWSSLTSPDTLLPHATWLPVRSHYPPVIASDGSCAWPEGIHDWNAAVNYLFQKVLATEAKIALVGCGALGVILAARLKQHGVSVIVMGGAIQVLFGIKGKRWRTHSVISTFWNSEWVLPSSDETPGEAATIEGGCYWA